ncbi:hypothetical protein H0O01_04890 [Candidatus Micrarchaeota archaeon]|nr:hypothetical protein [Candidatus Micrarchaeota archaeon]
MNPGPARKISISSQPPAPLFETRPPPRPRIQPSRHDSDTDYLARRAEAEKVVAQEVDECLKSGRSMRELVYALSMDYDFLDRGRFVDELCERIDKFPESRLKVGFIVSIFAIYEFTNHQKLAIDCADFCIRNSDGSHGMASACSTLLCRVADNCACAGAIPKMCRDAVLKTMEISTSSSSSPFSVMRAISEVSAFCRSIRIKGQDDSQPGIVLAQLPLRERDVFSTFLSAIANVCSCSGQNPEAINEFIYSCMDMCRAYNAKLFVSAISVLAWSAKAGGNENPKYVGEVLIALQNWDQEHLAAMETTLARGMKPLPGR